MPTRREHVFLVRMWLDGNLSDAGSWRGSIHEVATGRRRYVSGLADIGEFIEGALRSPEPAAAESPTEHST